MIVCPVCATSNDSYATVCVSCKGYLQHRIPNLDFFATAWKIIETPRTAFREITLAEHKNYAFGLYAFFGINLAFTGLWYFKAGESFEYLLYLIFVGIGAGLVLGVLSAPVISFLHFSFSKLIGKNASFTNSLGVTAYSTVPILITLVFVLPIELLTFGLYLFGNNPPPATIKPMEYSILVGADALAGFWSVALAIVGTRISQQSTFLRATGVVTLTFASSAAGLLGIGRYLAALLMR